MSLSNYARVQHITTFHPGRVVITQGASRLLSDFTNSKKPSAVAFLARHIRCDWGTVDSSDWKINNHALKSGARIISQYEFDGNRIWIISEASEDPLVREVTTILTPEEY